MKESPAVLHLDAHHAVLLKPAGISVHGKSRQTLQNQLRLGLAEALGLPEGGDRLVIVNRIDHATRGIVVVAWSHDAETWLTSRWDSFSKTYHAWMMGRLETPRGNCFMPLDGKAARSAFQTLGHRSWPVHGEASLVEWSLHSGRTHQLRQHAAAMGHPIVGDPVYAPEPRFSGKGLHLQGTAFRWLPPGSRTWEEVHCPPSKRFRRADERHFQPVAPSAFLPLFVP
jgi:23S rRNA-/tRNA-specific pseudouridylate synthase